MARKYDIKDWQKKLDDLNQPLTVIDKKEKDKKEFFAIYCHNCNNTFDVNRKALSTACILRNNGKCTTNWCPICNRKRCVEEFNDIATVRKDLIKYFKNSEDAKKYSVGSHAKVCLRCPDCGNEKKYIISNLCSHGFHCDYCSDNLSLGNKIIRNLCLQLPLDEYIIEFSDAWTQKKVYDCYFSYKNKKYLIEIDGRQHVMDTSWATKEAQEKNDLLKNDLAETNDYKIIRIKAYESNFDYIKNNILKSELSVIFNLKDINWNVIYKQTITSMDILVAQYFMSHKNLFLKEIAEYFKISHPTLKKMLVKMSNVGLCDYDKDKAFKNAMKNLKERRDAA